jgi:REP element-mobilizing transposase RayT
MPHRARPPLATRYPVHVSLRLEKGLPSLRGRHCGPIVADVLRLASQRPGFRVIHFCVVANHLHLLCEALDAAHLARGVRALAIRLARRLNARIGRRGPLFVGRYHARILRTPLQVQRALLYVLNNHRRHALAGYRAAGPAQVADVGDADPLSSGCWFDGWRRPPRNGRAPPPWAPAPRTWLLRKGWRRHGLLSVNAVPGPSR